jgi:glutaminase
MKTTSHMSYENILAEIYEEIKTLKPEGTVASYIPELKNVDGDKYGIHLVTIKGKEYSLGNSAEVFSIQSISKIFSLALSISLIGEKIWERIGVEPSGNPFNSIVQLEYEKGIPRNPFINPGAIVMADILISHLADSEKDYLSFIRKISGNENIQYNKKVAGSEKEKGFLNVALVNVLKHFGNINNDVEKVLSFYYSQCSIEMSCQDLAKAFLPFANHEKAFQFGNIVLTRSHVKRINAIMQTCGLYVVAGEFAYRVGLPGKSGVGGGIVAIHPDNYSVAVWSPRLNKKGNSVLGIKSLELLTTKTGLSIF